MKRLIITLVCCLAFVWVDAQNKPKGNPKPQSVAGEKASVVPPSTITETPPSNNVSSHSTPSQEPIVIATFVSTEHDFGKINEADGRVSAIFIIKNDGNDDLIISNVRASCGCVVVNWPKSPIPAGHTSEIVVTYNPKDRPGRFTKSTTVYTNASNSPATLFVKGEVLSQSSQVSSNTSASNDNGLQPLPTLNEVLISKTYTGMCYQKKENYNNLLESMFEEYKKKYVEFNNQKSSLSEGIRQIRIEELNSMRQRLITTKQVALSDLENGCK